MPYEWVEPELFLEYRGVRVYHCYWDKAPKGPPKRCDYHFTTNMAQDNWLVDDYGDEPDCRFGVRSLPGWSIHADEDDHWHRCDAAIKQAIDSPGLVLPEGQQVANERYILIWVQSGITADVISGHTTDELRGLVDAGAIRADYDDAQIWKVSGAEPEQWDHWNFDHECWVSQISEG